MMKTVIIIKKKKIIIKTLSDTKTIIKNNLYSEYYKLCLVNNNQNVYFFSIKYFLNKEILQNLFRYLTIKYPILVNKNNYYLVDPDNFLSIKSYFSLYLLNKAEIKYLIIHFNQYLFPYLSYILTSIDEFFLKLSKSYVIETNQYQIKYNQNDCSIHILSEIYYLVIILLKLPKLINNIKSIDTYSDYNQLNYKFNKQETKKLFIDHDSDDYDRYLINIIISSLSVIMDNYFVFINHNNNIDVIPIFHNMKHSNINLFLDKSNKANLGKTFIISYLSKIFNELNTDIQLPIIFLNLFRTNTDNKINIQKMYGQSNNKSIPILININYNSEQININISFKPGYKKIKYIFNEIIESLLN